MTSSSHPPRPLLGISFAMVALLLFVLLDVTSKSLSARYPVPFLVWARYGVHCALMLLLVAPRMGRRIVATKRPGLHLVRALLLLATSLAGVAAFQRMPLAEATGVIFASPLIVCVLAKPLLGEELGRLRIAAVVTGFCGVLLIARPGSALPPAGLAFALGAALAYALYQILTRKLSPTEHPLTLLFHTALTGTLATSAALPWLGPLPAVAAADLPPLLAMGALAGIGHFLLTRAFREAPASLLSPVLYMQLAWATLFGWLAFGDLPDGPSLAGLAVIGCAGAMVAFAAVRAKPAGPA